MSRPTIQCGVCAHFRSPLDNPDGPEDARTCDAFPAGIPEEIWENRADHRQPYEGDNGIQWEPAGDAAFPEYALNTEPATFGEAVTEGGGDA